MPPPNDAPAFSTEIHLIGSESGELRVSGLLADLLFDARERYVWGARTAAESQEVIVRLENESALRLADLHGDHAQWIISEVSRWGGNNETAIRAITSASGEQKETFAELIGQLATPGSSEHALRGLTNQPGLGLVMASKVYRFCCPHVGAAVDRHSSYFFNSLNVRDGAGNPGVCARFRREWVNGRRTTSRLAAYTESNRVANLKEYCANYLSLLGAIADDLNSRRGGYLCAASQSRRLWRPADVEMAAYFWWSQRANQYR
jgi:hypothetical protein